MNQNSIISPLPVVQIFLTELKTILISDKCELDILPKKKDEDSTDPFTTQNKMIDLGYDTDDVKRELLTLTEKEYIETIVDSKDSTKPPFFVFGKKITQKDVYIKVKIRDKSTNKVFCISFHYPRFPLKTGPYI